MSEPNTKPSLKSVQYLKSKLCMLLVVKRLKWLKARYVLHSTAKE